MTSDYYSDRGYRIRAEIVGLWFWCRCGHVCPVYFNYREAPIIQPVHVDVVLDGDTDEATVECPSCGERFELSFPRCRMLPTRRCGTCLHVVRPGAMYCGLHPHQVDAYGGICSQWVSCELVLP